jgi:hypothetical protein
MYATALSSNVPDMSATPLPAELGINKMVPVDVQRISQFVRQMSITVIDFNVNPAEASAARAYEQLTALLLHKSMVGISLAAWHCVSKCMADALDCMRVGRRQSARGGHLRPRAKFCKLGSEAGRAAVIRACGKRGGEEGKG